MDYNRVALFARVVEAGSFTAAAEQAGLPKSSVSRSISQLEEELGVRLLQRTTRALALTETGQAFYEAVRGAVTTIDEADEAAREHGAEPRGTVRLTAPPGVRIAPALARLVRKHPGIRVEVSITSREVDLITEGFDLAVRAGRLEDSSLVARRLGATEMILVASPAYLRGRGKPKSVGELAAHDWVLYRATAGRATLQLSGPDGETSVEVVGTIVSDDLGFCRVAVEEGAGIALLPVPIAAGPIAEGRLQQVLPDWRYGGASLFVVLPTARQVPARVALVRDFLVEHLTRDLREVEERCRGHKAARARAG